MGAKAGGREFEPRQWRKAIDSITYMNVLLVPAMWWNGLEIGISPRSGITQEL